MGWVSRLDARKEEWVLVLLLIVVLIAFVASLLPILYPGTIVSMLGTPLNVLLGELLGHTLKVGKGSLVTMAQGAYTLTPEGVLAIYVPVLVVILLVMRGR